MIYSALVALTDLDPPIGYSAITLNRSPYRIQCNSSSNRFPIGYSVIALRDLPIGYSVIAPYRIHTV